MNSKKINDLLFSFISRSTSPFHAITTIKAILDDAGFLQLEEHAAWQPQTGQPCYVIREDGALVAFNLGEDSDSGIRIVGSHADSPGLQLKPLPDIYENKYHKLGVEVYGGALLNPWFDRELSIAGRVTYRTDNDTIASSLVDFRKPIAVIPSLAIHLDREANKEKKINPQKDIIPLVGLGGDRDTPFTEVLRQQLKQEETSVDITDILGFDLFCYDFHLPCYIGLNEEFILSSRLDNLLSCCLLTHAIARANTAHSFLFICNNHEEIGSATASGARGNLLDSFLQRLYPEASERYRVLAKSFAISVDNAHATHPNFSDKHDGAHGINLNHGPVLKINANQKYASTSLSNALFKFLCREVDIPVQEFVMRNDLACGSTIGPLTSSKIGVKTVDIGAASLAMHSIRELTGSQDPILLFTAIEHFLQRDELPKIQQTN